MTLLRIDDPEFDDGTVKLKVGTSRRPVGGDWIVDLYTVEFAGEKLGHVTHESDEGPTLTETLYRCANGRFVVHLEIDPRWEHEERSSLLVEVTKADLGHDGKFAQLGEACGFSQAMTLEQALKFSARMLEQQEHDRRAAVFDRR